jgi:hypothetical protein
MLGRSKNPKAVRSTCPAVSDRQPIPRQMTQLTQLHYLPISVICENLRVWREASGQASSVGFVDWRFSVIAILAAALNSDASSALIDKSKLFISGTIGERLAAHAASLNAGAPRSDANTEAVVSVDHTALHSQVPAVHTGNGATSPKRLMPSRWQR